MLSGRTGAVGMDLGSEVRPCRDQDPTDSQLLERFVASTDAAEGAFESLVRRHGPMVWNVCRHVLNDPNDVEDAFQATFLVLVRRAGEIRQRDLLANWLYGVAYRVAVRARVDAARRRARERQGAEMSAGDVASSSDLRDVQPVIHDEVNRLPEKYRAPVVLCYLEGMTNEEAAAELRWPVGTVKGRLGRARELLRSRLSRRGVALSTGLLVVALSSDARAEVPIEVLEATVKSGMRVRTAFATPPPRPWRLRPSEFSWPRVEFETSPLTLALLVILGVAGAAGAVEARRAWILAWASSSWAKQKCYQVEATELVIDAEAVETEEGLEAANHDEAIGQIVEAPERSDPQGVGMTSDAPTPDASANLDAKS